MYMSAILIQPPSKEQLKQLETLTVHLKGVRSFGVNQDGYITAFGKFKDYIGKRWKDTPYFLFAFRAISMSDIGTGTEKSMKFKEENVLNDAFNRGLFDRLPLYVDHDLDNTRSCVGMTVASALSEKRMVKVMKDNKPTMVEMPYGVDVLVAIHESETKLIDNIRTGAVSCCSMTMFNHFARSHKDIPVSQYSERVGTLGEDGKEIHRVAVYIARTYELSILRKGADNYAVKYVDETSENMYDFTAIQLGASDKFKKVKIADTGNETLELIEKNIYLCDNVNSPKRRTKKIKNSMEDNIIHLNEGQFVETPIDGVIVPDADSGLTANSVIELGEGDNAIKYCLVPTTHMVQLRDSHIQLAADQAKARKVIETGLTQLKESIKGKLELLGQSIEEGSFEETILAGEDYDALSFYDKGLSINVQLTNQPICTKCGSGKHVSLNRAQPPINFNSTSEEGDEGDEGEGEGTEYASLSATRKVAKFRKKKETQQ